MVNAHKDEFDASEVAKEVAEGGDVFEKTKQNPKGTSRILWSCPTLKLSESSYVQIHLLKQHREFAICIFTLCYVI